VKRQAVYRYKVSGRDYYAKTYHGGYILLGLYLML